MMTAGDSPEVKVTARVGSCSRSSRTQRGQLQTYTCRDGLRRPGGVSRRRRLSDPSCRAPRYGYVAARPSSAVARPAPRSLAGSRGGPAAARPGPARGRWRCCSARACSRSPLPTRRSGSPTRGSASERDLAPPPRCREPLGNARAGRAAARRAPGRGRRRRRRRRRRRARRAGRRRAQAQAAMAALAGARSRSSARAPRRRPPSRASATTRPAGTRARAHASCARSATAARPAAGDRRRPPRAGGVRASRGRRAGGAARPQFGVLLFMLSLGFFNGMMVVIAEWLAPLGFSAARAGLVGAVLSAGVLGGRRGRGDGRDARVSARARALAAAAPRARARAPLLGTRASLPVRYGRLPARARRGRARGRCSAALPRSLRARARRRPGVGLGWSRSSPSCSSARSSTRSPRPRVSTGLLFAGSAWWGSMTCARARVARAVVDAAPIRRARAISPRRRYALPPSSAARRTPFPPASIFISAVMLMAGAASRASRRLGQHAAPAGTSRARRMYRSRPVSARCAPGRKRCPSSKRTHELALAASFARSPQGLDVMPSSPRIGKITSRRSPPRPLPPPHRPPL